MSDKRFTKTGKPRLGAVFPLDTVYGETEGAKVVGVIDGYGPEGRYGVVGVVFEFIADGERAALEWPLVPLTDEEKARRRAVRAEGST